MQYRVHLSSMRIVLIAFSLLLLQFVQPLAQQGNLTGSLEGIVLRAGGGEPIARARLSLSPYTEPTDAAFIRRPEVLSSTSNDAGIFRYESLAPNDYVLSVTADGYRRESYGPFEMAPGKDLKNIVFRLTRDAALSGQVLSGTGIVEGMDVQLVRVGYDASGRKILTAMGNVRTNDRGQYRLFGIPPGRYYLIARPANAWNVPKSFVTISPDSSRVVVQRDVRPNYTTTYYQGTTDLSRASFIDLAPGAELNNVDLIVRGLPGHRIRGRVIGLPPSPPLPGPPLAVGLSLVPRNFVEGAGTAFGISPRSDGTFEFEGVPPGEYELVGVFPLSVASAVGGLPPQPSGQIGHTSVDVSDTDLDNVVVRFSSLADVAGRLSLQDRPLTGLLQANRIQPELIPSKNTPRLPFVPIRLVRFSSLPDANGTFTYRGVVPGEYSLRFNNLPSNVYVKEARFGDVDVLANPLRILDGGSDSLNVVLSDKAGQVEGNVLDWKEKAIATAEAILIPDQFRDRLGAYGRALVDETGHFKIGSVAPGDYKVFLWASITPYAYFDPDFIREFEDKGLPVHVVESSKQTLEVRQILLPPH
jgi:hypothetical protein